MVKDTPLAPAHTCGTCQHVEPARSEQVTLDHTRQLLHSARLLDVGQACFIVSPLPGVPAHKPRAAA